MWLIQVSKIASVKKLLDKMNKWYFEKNGEFESVHAAI